MAIIGGIGLLIFVIYATVKTKSTVIDRYAPFDHWIGQTVTLNKETVLYKEKAGMYQNSAYPYILLDSLHPRWPYAAEQKAIGDLEEITTFAMGTRLTFEKAVQYTNGVSGFSYPTLFGTITSDGKEYGVGYRWGEINMGKRFDDIEECWYFHQAPWQRSADTAFYALPTATFW